jgi:uncharacterized protein
MRPFAFLLVTVLLALRPAVAADEKPAPKQFLGIVRLEEKYHAEAAWTDEAKAAVRKHFERLKEAAKAGQVILAGRTTEPNETTMGLIIFEAATLAEAQAFMAADPAVVAGVMKAETRPYQIAVARKP